MNKYRNLQVGERKPNWFQYRQRTNRGCARWTTVQVYAHTQQSCIGLPVTAAENTLFQFRTIAN